MFRKLQAVPFAAHHRYETEGNKVISGGGDLWTSSFLSPSQFPKLLILPGFLEGSQTICAAIVKCHWAIYTK